MLCVLSCKQPILRQLSLVQPAWTSTLHGLDLRVVVRLRPCCIRIERRAAANYCRYKVASVLQPNRTACSSTATSTVTVRLRPCCSLIEQHAAAQLLSLQPYHRTACNTASYCRGKATPMLQPERTACNSATIVAVRLRPCCSLIERRAAAQLLLLSL